MRSRLLLGVLVLALLPVHARAEQERSPLHGALTPGPHGVGFARLRLADPTRPVRPKRDAAGAPATADRARRIDVHVWYPATRVPSASPLTFADYMIEHLPPDDGAAATARRDAVRRFLGGFGAVSDADWARLTATRLLARRDAPAAAGRFPLVIGMLRPLSTTVTNEYLASHGYVVAMVDGEDTPGPTDPGAGLEIAYRDMEFAIPELRRLGHVDPAALAALGFSGAGFSQILLAMRHPDVDAVCDLESAIFDDRVMWPLQRGWGYDVGALRVPFLHTYSVPLSKLERRIEDFERMRYSTRYRYLVDAPQIHHWDFATEGMAASAVLRLRGDVAPRLQQAFETTNRYVLAFFNAHVKGDREELAFLRRDPAANGAPAGLATIREIAAVQPAPTPDELHTDIETRGIDEAMRAFHQARARDPEAAVFREARLNDIGYRLLRQGRHPAAIAVLRAAVELYPRSSNAYDSLAEALEVSGDRTASLQVTRQALEVLARQGLPDAERARMAEVLDARVKRLQ